MASDESSTSVSVDTQFDSGPQSDSPEPELNVDCATQLVLQAHKEAVNSLGGNGPTKLGTVATVVAAANATAVEATKEVEAAMKISLRAALGSTANKLTKGKEAAPGNDVQFLAQQDCLVPHRYELSAAIVVLDYMTKVLENVSLITN
ncbi:hypothetical protein PR202_ga28403 [Eleusine coracana subsp. coracana]|uniref:Uncharacterized protein n=1 Tax=Eleusine coracana subsp. coracana TaxID=191504 RepID=A0AAV5DH16_ELECO|nr:hypothetical protein PR202_ga28403 [Eleusine coracana subsp. coracana]